MLSAAEHTEYAALHNQLTADSALQFYISYESVLKHTSLLLSNRHSNTAFLHETEILLVWKALHQGSLLTIFEETDFNTEYC